MTPSDVLREARTILLIDWPTRDVPDTLGRAGYAVVASEGPGPNDYTAYELHDDEIVPRAAGRAPTHADIVYSHRPADELPEIVAMARAVGAKAVWCETGSTEARLTVESAGLVYADEPITDAVRRVRPRR